MRLMDIMETQVDTASPRGSLDAALTRMRARGIRHLVVTDDDRIVGVVSTRDIGRRPPPHATVADVMTSRPVTARPTMTVRQAANLMRGRSLGCLPVVEQGRLRGIVTVSDLLDLIGRGAERPMSRGVRPILAKRGPRRKPGR
jgi:acetoin utilization protein AcuB